MRLTPFVPLWLVFLVFHRFSSALPSPVPASPFIPVFHSAVLAPSAAPNSFAVLGETGVSAQQLWYNKGFVWIVDKTENNSLQVGGHPAWSAVYNLADNTVRALDVVTNTFCAGGSHLGNGSWVNVGGNIAVNANGQATGPGAPSPYRDKDGGKAVRYLTPCSDGTCTWDNSDPNDMPLSRWYPTVETLPTGDVIIIGGELFGSFVNTPQGVQNVPTYEFWPTRGAPVNSTFLMQTMPANLYPLTWLLPNGLLFMQANWQSATLNYTSGAEVFLPNITHAQRTYPGSGGATMLPLSSANNWQPTVLFCGGMKPERDDWNQNEWQIINTPTSSSCVTIDPMDPNPTWSDTDDLPENRGMGNLILLPNGKVLVLNGVGMGSAGYGWDSWALNQSYATAPVLRPAVYDPSSPPGQRWTPGPTSSTIPRMYHSSATLLPDGSVFVAGSNPNVDVINDQNNATYVHKTEYRAEAFYPDYYAQPRPMPGGLPGTVGYGGGGFNVSLPSASVAGKNLSEVRVVLARTGFSTHGINMGQRQAILDHNYATNKDGSATLLVSQLPPNPSLFVPGPALLFVVVEGVPSVGAEVMVGNGQLGPQPTQAAAVLPAPPGGALSGSSQAGAGGAESSGGGKQSAGGSARGSGAAAAALALLVVAIGAV